ncbi:methionyl-tRNA formyltransferase [Candidatus Kinetoplastibacterium desouzaii TCC079E]|uniref:Methionyl-tRNA formyltransferase n=1 Tax=Candidatus Kinetoplastidibacterium desouzai TCC079E TaxID=1208919 RepID=M1LNA8_9PROT|nr:methionyl-tRNA formyltransferase [Candidatus Kinetoplastibacterium desouzaii]AGF47192.1 methionyl-tRNA formyltransferase [Candidatus Kinetoplastibacterium desouzaii TCC079E]
MRIIFAGTSDFAAIHLNYLFSLGHEIPIVITQPDSHSGRGLLLKCSPVKQLAIERNVKVFQPNSLSIEPNGSTQTLELRNTLLDLNPDIIVVVSYGLILPRWLLNLPKFGCVNVHASFLPRWRGAAPIQRSIEYGDAYTGITIIKMDSGLDTGDILFQSKIPIMDYFTYQDLHDLLAFEGSRGLEYVLANFNNIDPYPQLKDGVTYAKKIEKKDSILDFSKDACYLERLIRSLNPYPGSIIRLPIFKDPIKVWKALVLDYKGKEVPGTIINVDEIGIDIVTSQGALRLKELQKSGSKKSMVADFVRGYRRLLKVGMQVIQ